MDDCHECGHDKTEHGADGCTNSYCSCTLDYGYREEDD